jgi:hypothetical protein
MGIRTPRGIGEWQAGSVAQLLGRLPALSEAALAACGQTRPRGVNVPAFGIPIRHRSRSSGTGSGVRPSPGSRRLDQLP